MVDNAIRKQITHVNGQEVRGDFFAVSDGSIQRIKRDGKNKFFAKCITTQDKASNAKLVTITVKPNKECLKISQIIRVSSVIACVFFKQDSEVVESNVVFADKNIKNLNASNISIAHEQANYCDLEKSPQLPLFL